MSLTVLTFTYPQNHNIESSVCLCHLVVLINRGSCVDGWSVVAWSASPLPDTDGQDEREAQAQLRPYSAAHYKTRNQWSGALHWWHWLHCHSSHQELQGCDSLCAVASGLKLLSSSSVECLLNFAKSVSGGVNDGTISWGHQWLALLAAGKIKLVSKHVLMVRVFCFSCVYYCKCVFHLFGQNSLGSMMSK